MDEVECDIENYKGRGWRYLPKPQTETDNANRGLDNSRYHAKIEFNNYFIIHIRFIYRIPTIICRCDVIITDTNNYNNKYYQQG